jgi:hypothetical protein
MLKLMAAEDSLEEKRLTGTETSPKEIVAELMDLAAMWNLDIPAEIRPRKTEPDRCGLGCDADRGYLIARVL